MAMFRIFVMQQNVLINTENTSTFKPKVIFIKITSNYDPPSHLTPTPPSFAFYKVTCQYPIFFKSNSERNFINQLIISLQESVHFQYLVHLTPVSPSILNQMKTMPRLQCSHIITFCSIIKIDQVQEQRVKAEEDFKQKCMKMNSILSVLKQKHKMQTKLSFWVKRFNDLLKQNEEKQIKQKHQVLKKQQSLFQPNQSDSRMLRNINAEKQIKN